MQCFLRNRLANAATALGVLVTAVVLATSATAASPGVNASELTSLGFKPLVATTKVQKDWVRRLPSGKMRAMQRTGKKYFIYPDAANLQVYVGGPAEYEAYRKLHPEQRSAQDVANKESAYRGKQAATMAAATAHDLSDPFLGVTWADLGW
ncbi:MAG: hypothetical protein U1F41_16235 [Burkholderiales bacterium]